MPDNKVTVDIAAVRLKSGRVWSVPRPGRHHTVMHLMHDNDVGLVDRLEAVQGFVLSDGRFVDRIEGAAIALSNGQLDELHWPPNLYSEDLW